MSMPRIIFRYSGIYDRMLHAVSKNPDAPDFLRRKEESLAAISEFELFLENSLENTLKGISALLMPWQAKELVVYMLPDWHGTLKSSGFSDPLTLILRRKENGSLDHEKMQYVLVHELCHVIQQPLSTTTYYSDLTERYKLKNIIVRNHLLTFALLKKILGDEYIQWTEMHHNSPAYKKALDLVEKIGADKIIQEAKIALSSYEKGS